MSTAITNQNFGARIWPETISLRLDCRISIMESKYTWKVGSNLTKLSGFSGIFFFSVRVSSLDGLSSFRGRSSVCLVGLDNSGYLML